MSLVRMLEMLYQETGPQILWDITRSLAGDVNNFILHGYPYSGFYPNTTWPGFTTFTYIFSEMHGRHQPGWHFYKDSMDYVARYQYIFQSGVPKVDLMFWSKFTSYAQIQTFYAPNDLVEVGYTCEYVSPDDFALPQAIVANGVFAPERPAFKAIILRGNDSLTVQGVAKLADYAHAGLPIIISGGVPTYLASYNASGDVYVNETLKSLLGLSNVHQVGYEGLAASVAALGIEPRTKVQAENVWYTYWRRDDEAGADYVFVYNNALGSEFNTGRSQGIVEIASTGMPYQYSAWTGALTPLSNYTQTDSSTSIWSELAGNQSAIVAFHDKWQQHSPHGYGGHHGHGGAVAQQQLQTPITLSNWTLVVEHWGPPTDLYDIDTIAVKHNTTHQLPQLTSWQNIDGLQNVSGRGYNSTTFRFSKPQGYHHRPSHYKGAIIDFGAIVHTLQVSINGHIIPPLDLTWAKADISEYLVNGEDTVEPVVSSTLYNVLLPIREQLETSGVAVGELLAAGVPLPVLANPREDYGLLNEVTIMPYTTVGG